MYVQLVQLHLPTSNGNICRGDFQEKYKFHSLHKKTQYVTIIEWAAVQKEEQLHRMINNQ